MSKPKKILALGSSRTVSGLNRIIRILRPTFDLERPKGLDDIDIDSYVGIIAHNRYVDPTNGKLPRILYWASNGAERVCQQPRAVKAMKENKPRAIWTNSNEATKCFTDVGLDAITMYRPNELVIPETIPFFPKKKRILWHWSKDDPCMSEATTKKIAVVMRRIPDVEIEIISSAKRPVKPEGDGLDHVEAGCKIDIAQSAPEWHGVVRHYDGVDFGRSTFQVFAYGRWYLYVNSNEEMVDSVPTLDDIPDKVYELLEKKNMEDAMNRHMYIKKQFNENKLHRRWISAVREAFGL